MTTAAERLRAVAEYARDEFQSGLVYVDQVVADGTAKPNFVDRLAADAFRTLVDDLNAVLSGECPEDPLLLPEHFLAAGQYSCPRCACLVVAGLEHSPHQPQCRLGLNEEPE